MSTSGATGTTGRRGTAPGPDGSGAPRRRRPLRVLLVVLAVLVLLAVGLLGAVAWYFSGLALAVDRSGVPPVAVRAGADGTGTPDGTIVLPDTPGMATRGLHGIRWQAGETSGWGVTGEVLDRGDGRVVRGWEDRDGVLPDAGATGQIDQDVYLGDPGVVGLGFEELVLDGDLGPMPAYLVPGPEAPTPAQAAAADTWVVFVHGRGGQREEANRYLPMWHELGHPVLLPTYRNDAAAPQDPSGRYRLGDTEWLDVQTAVTYALDQGAEDIVLAGWSMGGAVDMQFMARSPDADEVVALVLDAPVMDWRDTFEHQGAQAGLPTWLTGVALRLIEVRGDLDLDDLDWAARADLEQVVQVPVYLVHSDDDGFVPNGPGKVVAQRLGGLVTTRFDGPGEHTREWNVAPEAYDADMLAWFRSTLDG